MTALNSLIGGLTGKHEMVRYTSEDGGSDGNKGTGA